MKVKLSSGWTTTLECFVAIIALVNVIHFSQAESFGIKFLGNTTDNVTDSAGAVPITNWNNIANATFASGTLHSSDGAVLVTLSLTGNGRANGWNSGIGADGGDGSLMRGYCDAMANSPVTATISGLTGSSYTVYLYTQGDVQRPSNGSEWLPNYTINGSKVYTPILGNGFFGYVQGGMTLGNSSNYPSLAHGNCIRWNNGTPINGVITISANLDNLSYRSPLNGIELVLNTNSATAAPARPLHILPLGDSITWGYPDPSTTGGYRLPLSQLLTNANFRMDFVGTQSSPAPGLLYPFHEGHSGYRIDQINDGLLTWVNSVASPDIILLLIGTNDLGQNHDTTNAITRLDGLVSNITSNFPNAKVVVANLTTRTGSTDSLINTLFNPFVPGLVARHAANGEQVYFLDMHSALTLADLGDGLHPNPGGYAKMGKQWYNAIINLYAPFTSANLALNKSVSASSVNGVINVASNAVDGKVTSYWSSSYSNPQWLFVDLGSVQNINSVKWVWASAYGKSYQVQVSTNSTVWSSVYNTSAGLGGTNSVSFSPTMARYVRIYGTAQGTGLGYGISELQVFAAPLANLALNKTVTASSTLDALNLPASKVVDGDSTTRWSSQSHDAEWIAIDLGSVQNVGWVRLNWALSYGQSYEIQVSTNNITWTRVYNTSSGTGGIEDISFTAVSARYVRMYGMQRGTANGYSLYEFGIHGPLNAPANTQFQPLVYVSNVDVALDQTNSGVGLTWASIAQQSYGVQYATNLMTPAWFDYEPQVITTDSVAHVLFPLHAESQKFFRVKPALR